MNFLKNKNVECVFEAKILMGIILRHCITCMLPNVRCFKP